jgi:NosR/NirI family transcriptional regulator, nitrous oxide reductase regulator
MLSRALIVLFGVACIVNPAAQAGVDARLEAQLRKIFPAAVSFSPKGGEPPHFKVFGKDSKTGAPVLAGLAFWTTELDPLERGYDGPIKILVGMDTAGVLAGVIVADHHEPYGYFSVDLPDFASQFKGKSIRDPFRLGSDVDAVSRATMTVGSASRAVRNSARRVATQLLTPPK